MGKVLALVGSVCHDSGATLRTLHLLTHLILTVDLCVLYYPHCTKEETEAQRG